jgi:hypothetical protein
LEPIWFSKDEVSKEFEECQYKIIVSLVCNMMLGYPALGTYM